MDRIAYIKIQKQDAFATDLKGWLIITTKKKKKITKRAYTRKIFTKSQMLKTQRMLKIQMILKWKKYTTS